MYDKITAMTSYDHNFYGQMKLKSDAIPGMVLICCHWPLVQVFHTQWTTENKTNINDI